MRKVMKQNRKSVIAGVLLSCCVLMTFPTPVSATEAVILGGEEYQGYVEAPYEAPESIYEGPPVIQAGENIHTSYDARDYGQVTSVKYQGSYGTCWSFSTMAALESSLLSQGIYDDVDLSEYHLAYYNFNSVADPLGGTSNDRVTYSGTMDQALQAGGNVTVAYHALANWVGAVDEESAEYPTGSGAIKELPMTVESAYLNDIVHLQQAYKINKSDTAAIKQAIIDYGAVTASFYYSDYYMNNSTSAYYCADRTDSNHGVAIVGWDDNYSVDNFDTKPSNNGAWLVKNSWNTWFGAGGYCWISYEDSSLQSTMMVLVGEDADNYDNNYQYDGSYMNNVYHLEQAVAANVFCVQDGDYKESLEAVAFDLWSTNVNYSIQIYTNLTNQADPTSGIAMLEKPITGTTTFEGYYTIKLPQPVMLEPNQTFSVVISFDKNGELIGIPIEASMTWNNITFVSNVKPNQSLMQYDGYDYWWDIGSAGGGNLRIKAFTKNTTQERYYAVEGVSLTPESADIYVGHTKQLTVSIAPVTASNKNVTWSSSDSAVADVDANGLVTAKKQGQAVITCTTEEGGYTDTTTVTVSNIVPTGVSIIPENATVYVGDTTQLRVLISPDDATIKDVTWSSSDSAVAGVDADGLVTAKKQGQAVITCTTMDGGCIATATVTVKNVVPTDVTISPASADLYVGDTTQLNATIAPANATIKDMSWASSDATVATVDANGFVTAKKQGEAIITCTTVDGQRTDTITITVKNIAVTGVAVVAERNEVVVGEKVQLGATISPANATIKDVSWSSSDTTIATVDANGLVTTKKAGKVAITCTSLDSSHTDTVTITIFPVELVVENQKLLVGDNTQLVLNINGQDQPISVNSEYNWFVEPKGVVEVSSNGLVTGLGVGKATITCVHKEMVARTANVEVEIEIPFTDIKITDWQYPYVVYAYQNNLMSGKGEGLFDMNAKLTRAEFVTVLYSYAGKPEIAYKPYFSDVSDDEWYSFAVTWANENGVTAGVGDGIFGVDEKITREQLVVMLYAYAKKLGAVDSEIVVDLSTYVDEKQVSFWANEAVRWAVQNSIISGKTGEEPNTVCLDPGGSTDRGQCATMMMRFAELMKNR